MEQENPTEIAESSPADVNTESSTVQSEEATSKQATDERPFHEHPRFKELIEEKREAKERAERLERQLYEITSKLTPNQQEQKIQDNLYEAKTPEEKAFWQTVEKVAERKAEEREKRLRQELDAEKQTIYSQTGALLAKEFLKEHPEIQKGSKELEEIVRTAQAKKLDLDEAYKIVMFDKAQEAAANKAREQAKQKTQQKMAANVETKSIPQQSLPIQKKGSAITEDDLLSTAREMGISL